MEELRGELLEIQDFDKSCALLGNWLNQKERMTQTLGAVTLDPVILNSQLQQVELLQSEMADHENEMEKAKNKGFAILDKADADDENKHVSKQLDGILMKWDNLKDNLQERHNQLQDANDLSSQMYEKLQKLDEWTTITNEKVECLPSFSKHPNILVEEIATLKGELNEKRPLLENTKNIVEKLLEKAKDPSTKFELRTKIAAVERPIKAIEKLLNEKEKAVDGVNKESNRLRMELNNYVDYFNELESELKKSEPVSSNSEHLRACLLQLENLSKDFAERESQMKMAIEKGKKAQEMNPESNDARQLIESSTETEQKMKALKKSLNDNKNKLNNAVNLAERIDRPLELLTAWFEMMDKKLNNFGSLILEREPLMIKQKEVQSWQNEMFRKSLDHDNLQRNVSELIKYIDNSCEILQKTKSLQERWYGLEKAVLSHIDQLDNIFQKVHEIDEAMKDAKSGLDKVHDKYESLSQPGLAARDPKLLSKLETLLEDIDFVQQKFIAIDEIVRDLELIANSKDNRHWIELQELKEERNTLNEKIRDLLISIRKVSVEIEDLKVRKVFSFHNS